MVLVFRVGAMGHWPVEVFWVYLLVASQAVSSNTLKCVNLSVELCLSRHRSGCWERPTERGRAASSPPPPSRGLARFHCCLLRSHQMQQFKSDALPRKPEKAAAVPAPPDAPPASSSSVTTSVKATAPTRKDAFPPSASQPPQAAPAADAGQAVKELGLPLPEGTGGKEQYGYIVTNQR